MSGYAKYIIWAIYGVFAIIAFGGVVTSLLWGAYWLAFFTSLLALFLLPHRLTSRSKVVRVTLFIFMVCIATLNPLAQVEGSMVRLRDAYYQKGIDGLDSKDRVAIYLGNGYMSVAALMVGYPEVAMESFLLYFPCNGERVFESDFAMKSSKVAKVVDQFAHQLKGAAAGKKLERKKSIYWTNYVSDSPRVSLALNKFRLKMTAIKSTDEQIIDCRGWVPIKYPKKAWTPVISFGGFSLHVEEGLFWALQQIGWLHPYKAVWKWKVHGVEIRN